MPRFSHPGPAATSVDRCDAPAVSCGLGTRRRAYGRGMDDLTTQDAAAAFQAEAAERVIDAAAILVPECFQDEDGDHSPLTPPARSLRAGVS